MESRRFDDLTRALSARLPRRGVPAVLAGALAVFAGDPAEADVRARRRGHGQSGGGEPEREQRHHQDPGHDVDGGPRAEACAGVNKSCAKPKKGPAPTCCPGLKCDAAKKKCLASGGGGGGGCPSGQKACNGRCISNSAPCCTSSQQECNLKCIAKTECCGGCRGNEKCVNGACVVQICPDCATGCQECTVSGTSMSCKKCGTASCNDSTSKCQTARLGSTDRRILESKLLGLGFAVASRPESVVLIEDGEIRAVQIEEGYALDGAPRTAALVTVIEPNGTSYASAITYVNGRFNASLLVDENLIVQEFSGNDFQLSGNAEARSVGTAADNGTAACEGCMNACGLGAGAACEGVDGICLGAVLKIPNPVGKAIAFGLCMTYQRMMCSKAGTITCEELCKPQCLCPNGSAYCLGTCCNTDECYVCRPTPGKKNVCQKKTRKTCAEAQDGVCIESGCDSPLDCCHPGRECQTTGKGLECICKRDHIPCGQNGPCCDRRFTECKNGECVPHCVPGECNIWCPCPDGQTCSNNRCGPPCSTSRCCIPDKVCSNGECGYMVPDGCGGWKTDGCRCPSGQYCHHEESGQCKEWICNPLYCGTVNIGGGYTTECSCVAGDTCFYGACCGSPTTQWWDRCACFFNPELSGCERFPR